MIEIVNKGFNESGAHNLNILFNDGKSYLMDNHLAAIWCWLQKIKLDKKYSVLHIDRHYDLLTSQLDCWLKELRDTKIDLSKITLEEFLAIDYNLEIISNNDRCQLFRWDNYLSIFYCLYCDNIYHSIFATHRDGDRIEKVNDGGKDIIMVSSEKEIYELPLNLSCWIDYYSSTKDSDIKWIVNLDIDYFFTDSDDKRFQFLSDEFVIKVADEINKSWSKIEVLTIALSPDYCNGWENSIRVAKLLMNQLGLGINI